MKISKLSAYNQKIILKLIEHNQKREKLLKLSEHNQKAVLKLAKESVYSVSEVLEIIDMCARINT